MAAVLVSAQAPLRPNPVKLSEASAELIKRLRGDPFAYFRFVNRAWSSRVCEVFADLPDVPRGRLHGDAHVEQFVVTKDEWGLDDFDDSARGPIFIDLVRFLASLDLAARQRGWSADRDRLRDRFFDGLRRGLSDPGYRPPQPALVGELRRQSPVTRRAFLAWGERQMLPLDRTRWKSAVNAMAAFDRFIRGQRRDFAPGYFTVVNAGWLRLGVGSAATRKVLVRVQGPSADPDDDVLLEAKEVANLDGVPCLEDAPIPPGLRIVDGSLQLGRLRHDILAIAPTLLMPAAADRGEHWLEWWVTSWEPSYREVRVADYRSVEDLAAIAYDAGVQLGAPRDPAVRTRVLESITNLEPRLKKETSTLVEELLAGWRALGAR